ncbi:MAG: InlB B-repeat-containing protein, partial [Eubacteriales bacterium]
MYRTVTIKANGISLTYDEDYFPISGFYQRDSSVPAFIKSGTTYYASLFYRRSSYTLTLINGNTVNSVNGIRYGTQIENQYYIPTRPGNISDDYTFGGWFTTEGTYAGTEFDWSDATMPAKNLILYAKWTAPTFTGSAYTYSYGTSGGTVVDLGSIEYGGTISASALAAAQAAAEANKPNPTDAFGGWLILKNGSLILFNASMQIYENVVLYPVWISTENFSVTYNLGDATGTAPVDVITYGAGSQAQVKSLVVSSVTPPPEKVFIGWRSSVDSKIYYPNSMITIIEDTTLTAVWVYSSVTVTITYDGNGGATVDSLTTFTGGAINNTYHTVQSNPFLYAGKNFIGWNTASDASGSWYNPGDSVLLGVSVPTAPGSLYAIWEDQTFDVTVTADPVEGVSSKSGAGIYVYNASTTVIWTVAAGYEVTSVTDNGATVDAASYVGNSYTLIGITEDHAVVINTQKTLFTLSYDGNGGLAGGDPSYSTTKTMGTSFTVDANTFTRDGYYFLGWSTDSAATAADANYAPGSSVVMPSSNLTLYAVWAEKTALTLTANSATRDYDGSAKSVSGITPSIAGLTIQNTTAGASGTNPGVYATSFTNQAGLVILNGGVDVTEQYTVSWVDGALTINPQVTYRASANGAVIGT